MLPPPPPPPPFTRRSPGTEDHRHAVPEPGLLQRRQVELQVVELAALRREVLHAAAAAAAAAAARSVRSPRGRGHEGVVRGAEETEDVVM